MNIYYGKVDYDLSDHKPITGLFESKIKVVNKKIRDKIEKEIKEKYEIEYSDTETFRKNEFLNGYVDSDKIDEF